MNARLLERYAGSLEQQEYAYRTISPELSTLKQIVKWLIRKGHLTGVTPIELPVEKAHGRTTYCRRAEEVRAMVEFCRSRPDLQWLGHVLTAPACTRLRISELNSLRWADLDPAAGLLKLRTRRPRPDPGSSSGR